MNNLKELENLLNQKTNEASKLALNFDDIFDEIGDLSNQFKNNDIALKMIESTYRNIFNNLIWLSKHVK